MRNVLPSVKLMIIAVVLGMMSGIASPATAKPLKVFILAGQSNMQGHVNASTFDSMADDPKTAPLLKEMRNADGTPRVCQKVRISSIGCAGDDTTEQKRLKAASNGGYHYLGAAKIMAPIGKAFVEAMGIDCSQMMKST
jgi:hypothetical protein